MKGRETLSPGINRYIPIDHALVFERDDTDLSERLTAAALGQSFSGEAAVVFIWSSIPARIERRYAGAAYKVIAKNAVHVRQNLYLACEAMGCGACAIAAYNQGLMDELIGVAGA